MLNDTSFMSCASSINDVELRELCGVLNAQKGFLKWEVNIIISMIESC